MGEQRTKQVDRRSFLGLLSLGGSLPIAARLFAACPVAASPLGAAQAEAGGTVVYGYGTEPAKINMLLSNLISDYDAAQLVYSFLVRVNDELDFIPDLATEVPSQANGGISADGLTYTFRLRPNVTFHDGTPLTAEDVKFTQELAIDPKTQARTRVGYSTVESVSAPDATTVIFQLKEPFPAFLEIWAYTNILPKHLWQGKDANTDVLNREPVGSGPFRFAERRSGEQVVFARNPDYFKPGLPRLDQIIYQVVPDANTLLARIQTGEVQATQRLPTQQAPLVQDLPGVTLHRTEALADFRIWLNLRKPLLQDARVRQALSYSTDRQGIIDNVLRGNGNLATTYIPPQLWAFNPDVPAYELDQERAKSLLAEAGWTLGADGVQQKEGMRLSVEVWNSTGQAERLQILQIIQQQWKDVGAEMIIKPTDSATLFGQIVPGAEFDAYFGYWTNNIDPALLNTFYLSESPGNTTGYANPELDEILLQAGGMLDREERQPLYWQAQEIEARDLPMLHLYWVVQLDVSRGIENFRPNMSFQTAFWNAEEWALTS